MLSWTQWAMDTTTVGTIVPTTIQKGWVRLMGATTNLRCTIRTTCRPTIIVNRSSCTSQSMGTWSHPTILSMMDSTRVTRHTSWVHPWAMRTTCRA